MKKIKLFTGDRYGVQKNIDEWLAENPTYEPLNTSIAYGDYVSILSVVYDDGKTTKFNLNS